MSTPPPTPPPGIPETRDFKPTAHQPLLSPNGDAVFYTQEPQRALREGENSLARFLPAANFTPVPRSEQLRGVSSRVAFALTDAMKGSARMLRAPKFAATEGLLLPRAEIDAFESAVEKFLAQAAAGGTGGLSPFQQRCRRDFRLPNPETEPDAYWVYGSEFDRRLVILWGCERLPRTSVPLAQVVKYLRTREMAWEDKQELALKLALRPDEPLSRFLATKSRDGTGYSLRNAPIPPKKLRPFGSLGKGEWRSYDAAAAAYLAKAASDAVSPFERELRLEFRLPDLAKSPRSFFKFGSRLVLAVDRWPRDLTVPPCPPPAAPAAAEGTPYAEGAAPEETNLSRQLQARIRPDWLKPALAAAAVVIGAGALFFGFKYLRPPQASPISFTSIETPDENLVVATMSEAVDPTRASPATIYFVADNPGVKAVKVEGRRLLITPKAPLRDDEAYALTVKGLKVGPKSESVTSANFRYEDRVAPTLVALPSAASDSDGRGLLLRFSKPMNRDSFGGKVKIWPVINGEHGSPISVSLKDDKSATANTSIVLTAEQKLNYRMTYELALEGVRDLSLATDEKDGKKGNLLVLPSNQRKSAEGNLVFDYDDLLPPEIRNVTGLGSGAVLVDFDEAVDVAGAGDAGNYRVALASDPAKALAVEGVTVDPAGRTVTLRLGKDRLSTQPYKVTVAQLTDVSQRHNRTSKPLERVFSFTAGETLKIAKIDARNPGRLFVTFNKALWSEAARKTGSYTLLTSERNPTTHTVKSADPDAVNQETVVLTLDRPLAGGGYIVQAQDVEDLFGEKPPQPVASEVIWIRPPGVTKLIKETAVLWKGTTVTFRFAGYNFTDESARNPLNYQFVPAAEIAEIDPPKAEKEGDRTIYVVTVRLKKAPATLQAAGVENLKIATDAGSYKLSPMAVQQAP